MTQSDRIPSSEITPPEHYANRRTFMKAGLALATATATGLIYKKLNTTGGGAAETPKLANLTTAPTTTTSNTSGFFVDEPKTSLQSITHYNNYYEFSLDKAGVAPAAAKFVVRPWTIAVEGLVSKPTQFDLDDILKISPPQERVYRMRCVEAWSMVIPWDGFSLSKLLERVQPLSSAKYVAFETLKDPSRMPGQQTDNLPWPYVEGLRMDEAMHPLTLLASGIYGRELPPQNGAPLRLVIPWKYGFKGIKSIVKITLVDKEPPTTWNLAAPNEYGFYANVNPQVPHPRWSQATERRIEGSSSRPTLLFNGYAEQVAGLYAGMDLHKYF